MAELTEITIKDFKGISEVVIKPRHKGAPPVTTLIGLNESGKTTILEALSHFITGDGSVSSLFDGVHSKAEVAALIPVNRKANFTGSIHISARILLDSKDHDSIYVNAQKHGFDIEPGSLPTELTATREYQYVDSVYIDKSNLWDGLELRVKKSKAKIYRAYEVPQDEKEFNLWSSSIGVVQRSLPRIAYFPTFLVDMPKKIYLSWHRGETPQNKYYRLVFQDILDSLDEDLNLQKHVVDRISTYKEESDNQNWFSLFWGSPNKAPIDSVFTKISSAVTREVLGSWQKVFQRKISAKNVLVEWGVDTDKNDLPYASFAISDGESRYFISERSLGFRWFFSFLLFTAFKQKEKRPTLFLFDEPAANLHAKAQTELLKSFERTVAGGDGIIYSTHSHHMINPKWIAGAHIVENTALDYDSDDDTFGLNTKPTNIVLTPYRHFVAQHPNRTSYFQPVIDTLEYLTPEIVGSGPFVLVEGITDFYALKLAARLGNFDLDFSIMPGVGAGAAGPQISMLLGRGDRFLVLLDDDKAGKVSESIYLDEWHLPSSQVLTLGKLDASFSGRKLEGLISSGTRDLIKAQAKLSKEPSKKQIGMYLAEMAASSDASSSLDATTLSELLKVLTRLREALKVY